MHALNLNHLSYQTEEKVLLENISLEFQPSCLHGLLGPNGSGKSTLLKVLSGIWRANQGTITWNQENLFDKDRQFISRLISLVPQSTHLAFDFIVADLVAMGRYPYQKNYWLEAESPLVLEALQQVDIFHLRQRKVNQLSQGERQRVFIARALVTQSPILLLDEPTASLDIRHEIEIWQLLERLARKGKLIIASTHDLAIAERHCQKIAVLNHGKCIAHGNFSEIMAPQLLEEVFGIIQIPFPHSKCFDKAFG